MFNNLDNNSPLTPRRRFHDEEKDKTQSVSPGEEARLLKILQSEGSSENPRCYVTKKWWEKWCRYTGFEVEQSEMLGMESERPGPVETSSTDYEVEGTTSLSVAISKPMWNQLVDWYTEATEQTSSETSESKKIIKLRFFSSRRSQQTLLTFHCYETDDISEVFGKVASDLGFLCSRYYLFDPVEKREFFQHDCGTLMDNGIADNSVFCLLPIVSLGRTSGRVGLMNIGNTCYMNSSLQCLLHIPELMQYFLSGTYLKDISKGNPDGCGGQFADAFYRLQKKIWDGENDYFRPSQFWDVLSKYYALFAEKDQHDTAELAETVLDGLMEDCNLADIPKPYIPDMEEDPTLSDEEMAEKCWTYHKYRSKSFITDKFHGQYRILTKCPECDFESRKFDSFTVLHLGLPPPKMRTIVFTLVEICGSDLPRRYAVELSSKLLVKDLYKCVSKLLDQDEEQPWSHLCFVLKRPKLIFLQLQDPIARISDYDEVLLYSYKGSQYGPSSGGRKTCFVHQKLVQISQFSSYYGYPSQREEKQEFGYPFVLWLPDEDLTSFSKKRALFQGILEHSLRPFKRQHVVGFQEEENKGGLFGGKEEEIDESEKSDTGSMGAEADSTHSIPSTTRCSHEDPTEGFDDQEMLDENQTGPMTQYGPEENSSQETQNDFELAARSPPSTGSYCSRKEEKEAVPLKYMSTSFTGPTTHPNPLNHEEECSTVAHDIHTTGDNKDEEPDHCIGSLFDPEPENKNPTTSNLTQPYGMGPSYTSCCSNTGLLGTAGMSTISYRYNSTDAYTLTELDSTPKDDETRMIVIDWDSNADQYYDLHTLEHPQIHPTAENAEDKRRKAVQSVSIYDCLDHEFSPHPSALDGDNLWKCGSCDNMVNGVKSMRLWKTPDILLIGLKRFDYCEARDRLIKLTQMVDFPLEGLDLNSYYAPINSNDSSIYDLFGVCHHQGHGPKVGHYTSTVKSPDGKWFKFNDTWCTETSARLVVNQDAYLLFYRKRGLTFPEETEVLREYIEKEKKKNEQVATKVYESDIMDYLQSTSDDEVPMNGSQITRHFIDCHVSRGDNGSSSSNEMNNENDVSVSSSVQGQGSHSSTLYLTAGPSAPITEEDTSNGFGEGRSAWNATFGPVDRPEDYETSRHGRYRDDHEFEDTSTTEWPKFNDPKALDNWNADTSSENCVMDNQSGAMIPAYDSSDYTAFTSDSQEKH